MLQQRDQHDDGGDIDPAAKEAKRRRRLSAPATIDRTAEAEALVVLGAKTATPAAWLAWISGRVQATAALFATFGATVIGEIAINGEQEVVESGIGQQGCVQGMCLLSMRSLTPMAKPGRNDRCPCGSGKKYKACCLTKDEAAEREGFAGAQAERDARAAATRLEVRQFKAEIADRLRLAEEADVYDDELDAASNAVVDLVKAGEFDEAEAAARDLLARFPEVHDGWDRLGMVHEARGENAQAAACYRRVADFIRQHPDDFDADTAAAFNVRAAKLDPPAAG